MADYRNIAFLIVLMTLSGSMELSAQEVAPLWPEKTTYHSVEIDGQTVFYREAGQGKDKPVIVLLHGYPSSSHTYRELIPLLSGYFHIVAPDNLGSGYSSKPDPDHFEYSFDQLAGWNDKLLDHLGIDRCFIYMQDFGAPVGFRMMLHRPNRFQGIIAQNANAYLEGIPAQKQAFFRAAHEDQSEENVTRLFHFTGPEAIKHKQYLRDVRGREQIMSPDAWNHDTHHLSNERQRMIQVRLFQDYKSNLLRYPKWQAFMRERQPPTLLVWGARDPVFTSAGARAYLRDVPKAELHLLDAGHFAAEEVPVDIAKRIIPFVMRNHHHTGKPENIR